MTVPIAARILHAVGFSPEEQHGPLPHLLLVLTLVTGLVDAIGFLALGRVFVANMTNVVLLGFSVAAVESSSILATLAALAAFLAGAFAGGRLLAFGGAHRGRLLARALYIMAALVAVALLVSAWAPEHRSESAAAVLIALLGLAMGLQNATARRLAVPDLTSYVLTSTLTGLAADTALARSIDPKSLRRLVIALTMFLGAAIGAVLVAHGRVNGALALVLFLLLANGVAASRFSGSEAPWTASR